MSTDEKNSVLTYNVHEQQPFKKADSLAFASCASRLDADKVGWMPLQAYREAVQQQRLVICENNGDKVGFILWAISRGELKIYQCWVRKDARLILHGKALVAHVEEIAATYDAYRLRAWVAEDLAANVFWAAIGFENIGWRHSPRPTAKRKHLLWVKSLLLRLPCYSEPSLRGASQRLLLAAPT